MAKVQHLALSLVKPHLVGFGSWIQPVQVTVQSPPTLQQIHTPSQLGLTWTLMEGALHGLVQISNEEISLPWPQS